MSASGRGGSVRTIRVEPARGPLAGDVVPPGDKSIGHRGLLFGALAEGRTIVRGLGGGADNAATIGVLQALGVRIEREGDVARVFGQGFSGLRAPAGVLDCANSGTTMRLLAGVLAGRPFRSVLDGDESLRRRPMRRVLDPLAQMGARVSSREGRPPIEVAGGALRPAEFVLSVASAQVKTALLLAGLQAEGRTLVREPALSRDHTERLLPLFGVTLERPDPCSVAVRGPQSLRAVATIDVPGDPSAAAFWLVAASIVPGSRVRVRGVGVNPTRTGALDVLRAMGAEIDEVPATGVGEEPVADLVVRGARLRGTRVAGDHMLRAIDEFPVLAVAAAAAEGETVFADGSELRVKESDRLASMARGLAVLGIDVQEESDGMTVRGGTLRGGAVESHGDHRLAMAFAVAGLAATSPLTIAGAEAMAVSDPGFLSALTELGGSWREVEA